MQEPTNQAVNLEYDERAIQNRKSDDADSASFEGIVIARDDARVLTVMGLWNDFFGRYSEVVKVIRKLGYLPGDNSHNDVPGKRNFLLDLYSMFLAITSFVGWRDSDIKFPTPLDLVGKVVPLIAKGISTATLQIISDVEMLLAESPDRAAA